MTAVDSLVEVASENISSRVSPMASVRLVTIWWAVGLFGSATAMTPPALMT